jgi:1,4-alpha-glucan branching enzyme
MNSNETFLSPNPIYHSDPWLKPYADAIELRAARARAVESRLAARSGSLRTFASGHEYYGVHRTPSGWIVRERAPGACSIHLIGPFSGWAVRPDYELRRLDQSDWEVEIAEGALPHETLFKLVIGWEEDGDIVRGERIPSHVRRVVQDPTTKLFCAQNWVPLEPYRWRNNTPVPVSKAPRIYEAHVGMATESPRVGTYLEFTQNILPRIAQAGYDTIQLMAVQEHPYYGSFGYQVANFFAPSSRFGTPDELRELIDTAHGLGIAVVMDLVHSHAVRNELEGLSRFDGTPYLYFHDGPRGEHPAWNTRCFDYAKDETLHFLLSNCRYWLEEFRFDGFRFDGVTSMIYRDHGLGRGFSSYDDYFSPNIDEDALAYLTVANSLIHQLRPNALIIAEEVSGMPGLAAPRQACGVGCTHRLAMGIPDYWIKLLKEKKDEEWHIGEIWWELTNRRADEQTVSYCESHDQALVGDKTIMFWLADQEMYWSMRKTDQSLVIDRAVALHKMIRLITLATAGHGYLNFMGNEFGHPEWVDFPREGNGWSYHYARRQWSLRDDENLRYGQLATFDQAMMTAAHRDKWLTEAKIEKIFEHVSRQILAFVRGPNVFVFNFNPVQSFEAVDIPLAGVVGRIVLNSDDPVFGGFGRLDQNMEYRSSNDGVLRLYLPSRCAFVIRH